jgi:hypothetical protein
LRAAIQLVNQLAKLPFVGQRPEYTIVVPAGDYQLQAGELDIEPQTHVTITGAGRNDTTVIGNGERVLNVQHGADVTIRGFTITGGVVSRPLQRGGGIRNAGNLHLIDNLVTDNEAINSTGGAGIANSGVLTLTRTDVVANHSDSHGGGIYNELGTLTVVQSTISNNTAITSGAGLYNVGPATFRQSTVSQNAARRGAGIAHGGPGELVLVNSTISANVAHFQDGGAIYASGPVRLLHVTIKDNEINMLNATARLRNTIIDSPGCGGSGTFVSGGFNIDSGNSCGLNGTGDRSGVDPLLKPLARNGGPTSTHALDPKSPAVNAISENQCGGCPPVDQRGVVRPRAGVQSTIDIGAFEIRTRVR